MAKRTKGRQKSGRTERQKQREENKQKERDWRAGEHKGRMNVWIARADEGVDYEREWTDGLVLTRFNGKMLGKGS